MRAARASAATLTSPVAAAQAEIVQLRAQVRELKLEIRETERRPVTLAEAEERVDQAIDHLAQRGRELVPAVYLLSPGQEAFGFIVDRKLPVLESLAVLAPELLREGLRNAVRVEADRLPDGRTPEARAAELDRLRGELRQVETREVALLWELGDQAPWRGDLSPELVLGIEP
jgi:hypothetical protein